MEGEKKKAVMTATGFMSLIYTNCISKLLEEWLTDAIITVSDTAKRTAHTCRWTSEDKNDSGSHWITIMSIGCLPNKFHIYAYI